MSTPQPQEQGKIKSMSLRTRSTADGDECVRRTPAVIRESRANADVIRLVNENAAGSGKSISIFIDPSKAADLFEPVPPASVVLEPGKSVDWTVKSVIAGAASLSFRTDPDKCGGADQADIEVRC
jgi:hypothetical protein